MNKKLTNYYTADNGKVYKVVKKIGEGAQAIVFLSLENNEE